MATQTGRVGRRPRTRARTGSTTPDGCSTPAAMPEGLPAPTLAQRLLARLALASAIAAAVVLVAFAGIVSLVVVGLALAGLVVTAVGLWWLLTTHGLRRLLSFLLVVAVPIGVLVLYVWVNLAWVVMLSSALWTLAVGAGRAALTRDGTCAETLRYRAVEYEVPAPAHPVIFMNPRSGGGKVAKFSLAEKAAQLGVEVVVLDAPGQPDGACTAPSAAGIPGLQESRVDVVELARAAVDRGADLLGVAGGDGTQALVAGVAAEHGVPLLVVAAGTRNHFALDLGLDRDDPSTCLDALTDGVELHVDLGFADGRPFVNNASFGAYAAAVQSPAYRDDKVHTILNLLPDLLVGHHSPRLSVRVADLTLQGAQAILVSNNPYGTGDIAGLGRRPRLDRGLLGIFALTVENAVQAAGLLRGRQSDGLIVRTTREVVVDADSPTIPVAVDGEALSLPTPVRCTVRTGALRVRVPRVRPGVPAPKPPMNWRRLREIALTMASAAR